MDERRRRIEHQNQTIRARVPLALVDAATDTRQHDDGKEIEGHISIFKRENTSVPLRLELRLCFFYCSLVFTFSSLQI